MSDELRDYVNARLIERLTAEIYPDAAEWEHAVLYGDGSAPPTGILNATPKKPKIRQSARKAEMRRRGLRR